MPKRGDSAEYALEQPQVIRLLAACTSIEERLMVGSLLYLGLRIGELQHMDAKWITSDGMFHIPSRKECHCAECKGEWRPKSKAGARTLPIPKPIREDMLYFLRLNPNGLQLSRTAIYLRVKTIAKRAGIKEKGLAQGTTFPHALRATCATMLAASSMDSAALSYYMGWSSIKMGDHYVQLARAKNLAAEQAIRAFG